jgi:hypothetical protein
MSEVSTSAQDCKASEYSRACCLITGRWRMAEANRGRTAEAKWGNELGKRHCRTSGVINITHVLRVEVWREVDGIGWPCWMKLLDFTPSLNAILSCLRIDIGHVEVPWRSSSRSDRATSALTTHRANSIPATPPNHIFHHHRGALPISRLCMIPPTSTIPT